MSLLDGLISYWKLNEAVGTRFDCIGKNHLTDHNTVTQGTGKIGQAAQFTAVNSEDLYIADNPSLSTGNIDFTFAFWFKRASGTGACLFGKNYGGEIEYRASYGLVAGNQLEFVVGDRSTGYTLPLSWTPDTEWHFLVCWHVADGTINIQLDNGTPQSDTPSLRPVNTDLSLAIGAQGNHGNAFDGLIDGVGFWKRVLTSDERTALYNSGAGDESWLPFIPTDISGLQTWLKADSIIGLSDGDPVSTWPDASGNGRDQTQTGSARPTYQANVLNGLPVVRGDGTQAMTASFTVASGSRTIFVVVKDGQSSSVSLSMCGILGAYCRFNLRSGNNGASVAWLDSALSWREFSGPAEGFRILALVLTDGGNGELFAEGVSRGTGAYAAESGTGLCIFTESGGGSKLVGDIAELLLYDSALSSADRQSVEAYLRAKYAYSIPATLKDNLVAYWKLDYAGGVWGDSVGNHSLTPYVADPDVVSEGPLGTAASWPDDNSNIALYSTSEDFNPGDADFTLAGWASINANTRPNVIFTTCPWGTQPYQIITNLYSPGVAYVTVAPTAGSPTDTIAASNFGNSPQDDWFFWVFWHDSVNDTINLQINRSLPNSKDWANGIYHSGAFTFHLGGPTWEPYKGEQAGVGFWSRVLTADERAALYNFGAGLPNFPPLPTQSPASYMRSGVIL